MDTAVVSLDSVEKESLVNSSGVPFRKFKNTLIPKYHRAWAELLSGHFVIILTASLLVVADMFVPRLLPVAALAGGLVFGYVIAYFALFFHEAAHYNLARNRKRNDRLANIFIGPLLGQDIKVYRVIHFDHHRYLGMTTDTEHTYFDPLNIRFMLESLTGIKPLRVMLGRGKALQAKPEAQSEAKRVFDKYLLVGIALSGAIVLGALWFGAWSLAAAWVLGSLIFFPFFSATRQLLEHRSDAAERTVNYSLVPHGAVTRLFGDGPLSSTFGGAGFNRHLLHHWEPQISYTRLKDLEEFLLDTPEAELIRRSKTTYPKTFARLFRR